MTLPAIGSKWRSKRNGRIGTVEAVGAGDYSNGALLLFVIPGKPGRSDRWSRRWLGVTSTGKVCGYEPAE